MPFSSITIRPGVNTVMTPTLNTAGLSKSNLIRFRQGLIEKMGGWTRFIANAMPSVTRDLHAWQDLQQRKWLAAAGVTSLNVMNNGTNTNITPTFSIFNPAINVSTTAGSTTVNITDANITGTITAYDSVFFNTPISIGGITLTGLYPIAIGGSGSYSITTASPALTTAAGGSVPQFDTVTNSITVTVTFANHNLSIGNNFVFPIPTVVGGITISGSYTVLTVPSTSTFTIAASAAASSTATVSMNGGNAQYLYYFTLDPSGTTSRLGPPGAIGQFPIGEGRVVVITATSQVGINTLTADNWTSDNWGQIYLACPDGGGIYYWNPTQGFSTATLVGTAPPFNKGIFIAMPQQILVAYGSTTGTNNPIGGGSLQQDSLMIRWSDQLDYTNWTVSSLTQAGSYRIPNGSEIRGAMQAPNQALIWTDIGVWSMQYIGYPLVFGFNQLATECGLVGPHAAVSVSGLIIWMNENHFCILDGNGVRPLPCSVWDTVFQDLDRNNMQKSVAGTNRAFNEIIFFYPSISGGTGECDKYVKFNYAENIWDVGSIGRSAWIDESVVGTPIGADPATLRLQQHEQGYNADGVAMDSFFETGYFVYGDGENFSIVDHFEPDAKWTTLNSTTSAQLQVTLSAQNYPNDVISANPTLTMTSTATYLTPRLRGRQMKWRVESTDLNSWWRWGLTRYRWGIDGRR